MLYTQGIILGNASYVKSTFAVFRGTYQIFQAGDQYRAVGEPPAL